MKRFDETSLFRAALVAAIFLCLALSIGGTVHADSDGAGTVTASALNMRSEASTSSSVVTSLTKGTVVVITGSTDGWYQVSYDGYTGYVYADYLSVSSSAEGDFGTGTVTGGCVRVRSGPSTDYSVLGEVTRGTSIEITGVSDNWYQVSYNGSTGYVRSDLISLSSDSQADEPEPVSDSASDSSAAETSSETTGTINASYVRMRSGPSTEYSVLETCQKGTTMTVTGTSGDWYKVTYNGVSGYVYKTYLTVGSSTSTNESSSSSDFSVTDMDDTAAAVTASALNMRSGPSTSYSVVNVLSYGTSVTLTGTSGDWYQISYNGSTGYVKGDYVTTDTSSVSTSVSTEGEKLVAEAKKYLGVSYVYGGTSPSGFDCSGFVYYVYKQCGYSITRTATSQNSDGTYVSRSELQPGDIIIFYNSAKTGIGHAGIYIGDGKFIHASSSSGCVVITSLSSSYYDTHYYSARRVA